MPEVYCNEFWYLWYTVHVRSTLVLILVFGMPGKLVHVEVRNKLFHIGPFTCICIYGLVPLLGFMGYGQ